MALQTQGKRPKEPTPDDDTENGETETSQPRPKRAKNNPRPAPARGGAAVAAAKGRPKKKAKGAQAADTAETVADMAADVELTMHDERFMCRTDRDFELKEWEKILKFPNPFKEFQSPGNPTAHKKLVDEALKKKMPEGIICISEWDTSVGNLKNLYKYFNFDDLPTMYNFIDNPAIDILRPMVYLLFKKWHPSIAYSIVQSQKKSWETLDGELGEFMRSTATTLGGSKPPEWKQNTNSYALNSASHTICRSFNKNRQIRRLLEMVVSQLKEPMFIPVMVSTVDPREEDDDRLDPNATILCNAVQLLMFAPLAWDPDSSTRTYSPCNEKTNRFPSPKAVPGEKYDVAGVFSLEDLNRAVLSTHLLWTLKNRWVGGPPKRVPSATPGANARIWTGYRDPANPPDALTYVSETQSIANLAFTNALEAHTALGSNPGELFADLVAARMFKKLAQDSATSDDHEAHNNMELHTRIGDTLTKHSLIAREDITNEDASLEQIKLDIPTWDVLLDFIQRMYPNTVSGYIAFYDEWAGDGDVGSASSARKAIKQRLDDFCQKYRKECQLVANKRLSQSSSIASQKKKSPMPTAPRTIEKSASARPQPKLSIEPSSNAVRNAEQPSPEPPIPQEQTQSVSHNSNATPAAGTAPATPEPESQEQNQSASLDSSAAPAAEKAIDASEPEPQPEVEESNNASEPASHGESEHTESQVQQETEQNNNSGQALQDTPETSAPIQVTRLDTYIAGLFAVDAEFTVSNAVELLVEMKPLCNFSLLDIGRFKGAIADLAILLRLGALKDHPLQPEFHTCIVGEWCRRFNFYGNDEWKTKRVMGRLAAELRDVWATTQQFARSASLGTNPLSSAAPAKSREPGDATQSHVLTMAKGCIERTIRFAQIAIANLDAVLQGNANSNDVHSVLRCALDGIREQLPAVTDAFTSEMRNNVLGLVHCAQIDGSMRTREVREVVMAVKVSLETLLENLTIIERSANPSSSGSGAGSNFNADKEDDTDEEMVDAIRGVDNGGW